MHWISCGLIIFGFAAPSAVVGVPYALGTQGILVGTLLCLFFTAVTAVGALLILDITTKYEDIKEFKDMGKVIIGPNGSLFGTLIQNGNFLLFLPVALDLVASAAESTIDPTFKACTNYFTLGVAVLCLATTQIRSFSNGQTFATISLVCVFAIGIILVVISSTTSNELKEDALVAGNPASPSTSQGFFEALLGVTTALWSYVPALIVIELREAVPNQQDMVKAILFSAGLNVVFYITIGIVVVCNWGWDMADPVTILPVWPAKSAIARVFGFLLFLSNIISYAFDSIPLTSKFVVWMSPDLDLADWSMGTCFRYLRLSVLPWAFGLLVALLAPNLFVILAFVTALTVPWVSMIFPAYCFLIDLSQHSVSTRTTKASSSLDHRQGLEQVEEQGGLPHSSNSTTGLLVAAPREGAMAGDPGEAVNEEVSWKEEAGAFRAPLLEGNGAVGANAYKSFVVEAVGGEGKARVVGALVLGVGIVSFIVCLVAALGKVALPVLRGPSVIGCDGWTVSAD